ncbi:MAG: hypothetical protein GYA36_21000 [Veillonellaceae bacterium]|nr:hypothetical protein [Veillonellaceae bacterium]
MSLDCGTPDAGTARCIVRWPAPVGSTVVLAELVRRLLCDTGVALPLGMRVCDGSSGSVLAVDGRSAGRRDDVTDGGGDRACGR